jgi:hypothetical protein
MLSAFDDLKTLLTAQNFNRHSHPIQNMNGTSVQNGENQ